MSHFQMYLVWKAWSMSSFVWVCIHLPSYAFSISGKFWASPVQLSQDSEAKESEEGAQKKSNYKNKNNF